MGQIGQILEIAMIIAFGLSWPNNIITTLRNKSARGKSLLFLILIDSGYVCGILGKILSGNIVWYVMFFYVLNFIMVSTDMCLYFYYKRRDKQI
ncbi:MAG: hypothetical protein IKY44_01370 [Clostridia bacterium]|nr:hypothetical protein [Clostridia bacterium]